MHTPTAVPTHCAVSTRLRPRETRPSDVLDDRFLARTTPKWDRASQQAGFHDLDHALAWACATTRSTQCTNPIGALADRLHVPYAVLASVTQVRNYFAYGAK